MNTQHIPANPLVGNLPDDTLNNIVSVLALLEVTADTIATQQLTDDAAAGLTLMLGLVGDAVRFVRNDAAAPLRLVA